jgi:GNAT superfamily N-acetyltransferase
MLQIKDLTFFDYLFHFPLSLPPLGIYAVRHSQLQDGFLMGAFSGGVPIGIAVTECGPRPVLTYLFVHEDFRRQGIGMMLVREVLNCAKSKMLTSMNANVVKQSEHGETADRLLRQTGFEVSETATVIRYINDEKCKKGWALFEEKRGRRICGALEGRGFRTASFDNTSAEVFHQLKDDMKSEFPAYLDPFQFIDNTQDRLVSSYSFITVKSDKPAAFITVTTADDKTLVFQQMSTAYEYQGSGVFLLPFAAFMERFLSRDAYSKASAVIYDKNDRMQKLVHSFLGALAYSMKTQNVYQLRL